MLLKFIKNESLKTYISYKISISELYISITNQKKKKTNLSMSQSKNIFQKLLKD